MSANGYDSRMLILQVSCKNSLLANLAPHARFPSRGWMGSIAFNCILAGLLATGCKSSKTDQERAPIEQPEANITAEAARFHDEEMFALLPKDTIELTSEDIASLVSEKLSAERIAVIAKSDRYHLVLKAGLQINDISRFVEGSNERRQALEVVRLKKEIDAARLTANAKSKAAGDKPYYEIAGEFVAPTYVHFAAKTLIVQSRNEELLRQVLINTNGKSAIPKDLAELLQHVPSAHHVRATTKPFIPWADPNFPITKLAQSIKGSIDSYRIKGEITESTQIMLFPSEDEARRFSDELQVQAKAPMDHKALLTATKWTDEQIKSFEDSLKTQRFWSRGRASYRSFKMSNRGFEERKGLPPS